MKRREVQIAEDIVAIVGERREQKRSWWRERPAGWLCERWEIFLTFALLLVAVGGCFVVACAIERQEEARKAEESQAEAEFQAEMRKFIGREVVR